MTNTLCYPKCTPKIKYFGINPKILDSKNPLIYNSDGSLNKINLKTDLFESDMPAITIDGGSVLYYSKLSHKYQKFDSDFYDNVAFDVKKESFDKVQPEVWYSISLSPADPSKPMIFGQMQIYDRADYNIETSNKKCITNCINEDCGLNMKLYEISDNISDLYNDRLSQNDSNMSSYKPLSIMQDDRKCSNAFYYTIKKSPDSIIDYKLNNNGKTIDSIIIDQYSNNKPDLTLSNGKIQYLDLNSDSYKDFDQNHYSNIRAVGYDLRSLVTSGVSFNPSPYFLIRISQEDTFKPAILGNYVIYPNKSYMLNDVSEDGTYVDCTPIPMGLNVLLQ